MARPKGSENKDKPFRDALRLAINESEGDVKKLRKVAEALIAKAVDGDVQAIREIGDRLDGKPAQAIVGGDDDDAPIRVVSRIELVAPTHDNSAD